MLLTFSLTVGLISSVTVSDYLTTADQSRLQNVFSSGAPYKDLPTAYWSLRGRSLLNALPKDSKAGVIKL